MCSEILIPALYHSIKENTNVIKHIDLSKFKMLPK